MLRRDRDKRALIGAPRDMKYAPTTHALKLWWCELLTSYHKFLVVKIERNVIRLRYLLLQVLGRGDWACAGEK